MCTAGFPNMKLIIYLMGLFSLFPLLHAEAKWTFKCESLFGGSSVKMEGAKNSFSESIQNHGVQKLWEEQETWEYWGLALLDLSHLFHMLPAFEIAIISWYQFR